ncbi:LLM class flavin-dependent oxidoreductase [Fodinicola feengrottensis]|uniref:LLM class flavin-dependent oxidoreductase n=1 Tax=Fodinicola feengrottensis TaxID=435914 RepID=UPI002442835B|nr:LLM class flavin-dependent oxidoreductase [Fodinicola feengrottensis]
MRRLWDSWEDGAEIRDAPTGRFIDRDKLHYVDFAGEFFSVRGPSITPRSPQGQPLVSVRVDDPAALPIAAQWADIVHSSARQLAEATDIRQRVRAAVAAAGRDPDQVAFSRRRRHHGRRVGAGSGRTAGKTGPKGQFLHQLFDFRRIRRWFG